MAEQERSCASAILDWLVRPVSSPNDSEETAQTKRFSVLLCAVLSVASVLVMLTSEPDLLMHGSLTLTVIVSIVMYVGWVVSPSTRMDVFAVGSFVFISAVLDYNSVAGGSRSWTYAVIALDCALVFDVPQGYTATFVAGIVVYVLFVAVDRVRFQLYAEVSDGSPPWMCACADPPCSMQAAASFRDTFSVLFVFLSDFHLTRGFSTQLRRQIAVVSHAVEVTETMAQLLSLYEVEEGMALLEGEQGRELPDGLRCALHKLLNNLDEYRPYLPDVMLVREGTAEASTVEPPGLGVEQPAVTVCFTDIQSSTELWEWYPQGMHTALHMHNDVIRRVTGAWKGYEVKVIGDSFMLAFSGALEACGFAVAAQEALLDAKWPSDLLQHPLCTPAAGENGKTIWNGPRVRIGLNCGPVRVEKNPVTGRCDYFGATVNTAARVESCLQYGGLVGVTAAVLNEVGVEARTRLGDTVVSSLGAKTLKGVAAPVEVTVLLSERLADRLAVLVPTGTPPALASVDRRRPDCRSSSGGSSSQRSSVVDFGGPLLPRSRAARTQLSRRTATCSTFRAPACSSLADLGCSVGELLETVIQAADMTQGVLTSSMSVQCVVVWNGPRACGDHYSQCLRGLDHVRNQLDGAVAGACSGEMLHGSVAAGRKKHATVIGGCVELSVALAEEAELAGESVLAATTFGTYCTTQRRGRRFAQWTIHGGSGGGGNLLVLSVTEADDVREWDAEQTDSSLAVVSLEPDSPKDMLPGPGRLISRGAGMSS